MEFNHEEHEEHEGARIQGLGISLKHPVSNSLSLDPESSHPSQPSKLVETISIAYFDFCLLTFDLILTQLLHSKAHNGYDLPTCH